MNMHDESRSLTSKLMLRLLPAQVFLAAISAMNSVISSLFAGNFLGPKAMTAVGLYLPLNMMVNAVSTMLVGGATILSGKYIGENARDRIRNAFSLDLMLSLLLSAVIVSAYLAMGLLDLSGFLTADADVRRIFNQYLLGQAVGVMPLIVSGQLSSFLSLENRSKRTTAATFTCVLVSLLANLLFVRALGMGAFGLALASSVGMWAFLAVQAEYYISGRSSIRVSLSPRGMRWSDFGTIIKIGAPGAMNFGYQALRGILLNRLIQQYVGADGLSAFATNDSLLRFFWAIPFGMVAVSRMLFSVSVGEEDRRALSDIMRGVLRRYLPMMIGISGMIVLLAQPLTRLYYRDAAAPVYAMTVLGFRLLPLAMPFSVFTLNYTCYGQTCGKMRLVHLLSLLNGLVDVVAVSALLLPSMGMTGVGLAHIANGVVQVGVILGYACARRKGWVRTVDDLMAFPADFGAAGNEWMNLRVRDTGSVVRVSQALVDFCLARGVDRRQANYAGLAMEEMAGNIVSHGFAKDNRPHEADIRVTCRDDALILRIKDDCIPFDPLQRLQMLEPDDRVSNIGIRMVYRIAEEMQYQSILGLNALTVRIRLSGSGANTR